MDVWANTPPGRRFTAKQGPVGVGSVRPPFRPQGRDQAPGSAVSVLGNIQDHDGSGSTESGSPGASDTATGTQCMRSRSSGNHQSTLLRWAKPTCRDGVVQRFCHNSPVRDMPPAKKLRARVEGLQPSIRNYFAQQGQALDSGAGKRPCPFADGKPSRHLVANTAKRPKA